MAVEIENDEGPQLNMNSMMDIVFLLLIFFILQPFKAPEMKIPNELPKNLGQAGIPPTPIATIGITILPRAGFKDQSLFQVDNRDVPISADLPTVVANLKNALQNASEYDTTIPVVIKTQPTVKFRWVVAALDACMAAGMSDVKFGE